MIINFKCCVEIENLDIYIQSSEHRYYKSRNCVLLIAKPQWDRDHITIIAIASAEPQPL
jgi:hypothetical protein